MKELQEKILPDDYPVFWDYLYVVDDKVIKSDIQGTILDLKRDLEEQGISCKEIKSCDIIGRQNDQLINFKTKIIRDIK